MDDTQSTFVATELTLSRSAHLLNRAQDTLEMLMAGGEDTRLPLTTNISGKDITTAIELAMKMDDYLQRTALRKTLKASLIQAAEVLAGTIQEDAQLGDWADNLGEKETYGDRATAYLATYRSLYD